MRSHADLFGGRSAEAEAHYAKLASRAAEVLLLLLWRLRAAVMVASHARSRNFLIWQAGIALDHAPSLYGRRGSRTFLIWQAGIALDLVCASLDECGLWEMRACIHRTGGAALQVAIDDDDGDH